MTTILPHHGNNNNNGSNGGVQSDSTLLLKKYYQNFFPTKEIYDLYNAHEEFRLIELVYQTKTGKYPRCQVMIQSADDFRSSVLTFTPQRIEIVGYNNVPYLDRHKCGNDFAPIKKHLVFDIDIDDQKQRVCECRNSTDKGVYCEKCWFLVTWSCLIIAQILKFNFGFKNVIFVFSGRRGMHVWVLDKECMKMSEATRETIVNFIKKFNLKKMNAQLNQTVAEMLKTFLTLNPNAFFENSFTESFFAFMEAKMPVFKEKIKKMYDKIVVDKTTAAQNQHNLSSLDLIQEFQNNLSTDHYHELLIFIYSFVCIPRLDESVTQRYYHPIKMPFCIHDSTKNICHLIDPENLKNFYPSKESVIEVSKLLQKDSETLQRFKSSLTILNKYNK